MYKILLFFIIFISLSTFTKVKATNQPIILINEIAWMGSTNSATDEWIELFNPSASPVSLRGWTLKSADGKLKIILKGTIDANNFYLLERTDDTSVPNTKAEIIYKGALTNNGMALVLYDASGVMIDQINNSGKWLAGNSATKQTMERSNKLSWQTSVEANGTPKTQNSERIALPKSQKTDNSNIVETNTAALSKTTGSNPWLLFLVALGLTIISATIMLAIKLKISKKIKHVGP